ncbi:peroxide stress protein YaaA [Pseudaeromonas sharmana]|uniref:UPF0246 protein ACFOSS_07405 n=1 Tax=Pseudaeromonas sharmana TaxID=328412 RepID=A0ABV8CM50_9GAMM
MLMVISPAKTLDYSSPLPETPVTQPELLAQASELVALCRQLTPAQLASLMSISDKLAGLNAARFAEWALPLQPPAARPALFAFKGDVYTGLQVETLGTEALQRAQSHLRILSGLYGVLRPLDLMLPYRLEMGTALENAQGRHLYAFWGDTITDLLNQELQHLSARVLVNLASEEYFKAVRVARLQAEVISPVFEDEKNGRYKIISFYAKKARGLMCRYALTQGIDRAEGLLDFDLAGYRYIPELSTPLRPLFRRAEQSA